MCVQQAIAASVLAAAETLNRYPDRDATELCTEIARYLSREAEVHVKPSQVWPANGSNEVMHHILLAFGGPGRSALTFPPTYSMYPEYARDTFTRLISVPRNSDFSLDTERAVAAILDAHPTLTLIAAPNNPTGTPLPLDHGRQLAEAAAAVGGLLVIDEAYAEFRRVGQPSLIELTAQFPNVIVTRTMSKAFGLAGARVGYAVADPAVVDALRVVRLPYHLSAVTQATAIAALRHAEELQQQLALLRSERDALAAWLVEQGYVVPESDANFLLFGLFADRHAVWSALRDAGVLIRETGPAGWLRVSVGTPDENTMFRHALSHLRSGIAAPLDPDDVERLELETK
jgi:histidinol-phosphate aminotransferase